MTWLLILAAVSVVGAAASALLFRATNKVLDQCESTNSDSMRLYHGYRVRAHVRRRFCKRHKPNYTTYHPYRRFR